jgi:hypothetical protein
MPIVGLVSPKTGEKFSIEEGIKHFEEEGIMPAEAIQAMLNSAAGHGGFHARVSPSICDPETTCRREQVLKRFLDYYLDPFVIWNAQEGILWHDIFEFAGKGLEGWKQEVVLPPDDALAENVIRDPDDASLTYEIFPGIFMRGRVDKHDDPFTTITDFKTENWPKTYGKSNIPSKDWGEKKAKRDWPIQLSLYAFMLEAKLGKLPEKLFVWRMYRGSREKTLTFRKFEVPLLSKEMVWGEIGEHVTSLVRFLQGAMGIKREADEREALPVKESPQLKKNVSAQEAVKNFCRTIPMDGKDRAMFGNQKCFRYCVMQDICFGLEGKTVF